MGLLTIDLELRCRFVQKYYDGWVTLRRLHRPVGVTGDTA